MEYQRFNLHDRRKTDSCKANCEHSSSVEVCASFSGFLSTWDTLKGLGHLQQSERWTGWKSGGFRLTLLQVL